MKSMRGHYTSMTFLINLTHGIITQVFNVCLTEDYREVQIWEFKDSS